MLVLIVEDDEDFVEELHQVFNEIPGKVEYKVAGSRSSAFEFLDNGFFDLIVLDLKIPTLDGALDGNPEHGHVVFAHARMVSPGTPIVILTGSPVEDFIPAMLRQQQQVDIWSEGKKVGTVDFLKKSEFDKCPEKLAPIAAAVNGLSDVELEKGTANLILQEDRMIRIFSKKVGGTRCHITQLGGGLSGAKVFRLRITDSAGMLVHDAVAKLGPPNEVQDEGARFDRFISRLDPSATPRKLATLEFGAGAVAGNFYGLAAGFDSSAFDVALRQDGHAALVVGRIAAATKRWSEGVGQTRRTIRELRQRVLHDDVLENVLKTYPIEWLNEFETRQIQTRWSCIHGDLHGSNVLVSASGTVVLIDYGDVGDGPAGLDPVTLELSLLFHPQAPTMSGWPSSTQTKAWGDIDSYLLGCPCAEFLRACRSWASEVSAGKREMAVAAYSYLIRQLKYPGSDKSLVLRLLDGVKASFDAT